MALLRNVLVTAFLRTLSIKEITVILDILNVVFKRLEKRT